jgi:hypothetical protein
VAAKFNSAKTVRAAQLSQPTLTALPCACPNTHPSPASRAHMAHRGALQRTAIAHRATDGCPLTPARRHTRAPVNRR